MRRLLVTGGAGFIGANFVRMVLEEHPDKIGPYEAGAPCHE